MHGQGRGWVGLLELLRGLHGHDERLPGLVVASATLASAARRLTHFVAFHELDHLTVIVTKAPAGAQAARWVKDLQPLLTLKLTAATHLI